MSQSKTTQPIMEKTFQVALSESEACLIISALWQLEHYQIRLAKLATAAGRDKESRARMETGIRILELAVRIEKQCADEGH